MAVLLSNESFIHLLMARYFPSSNKLSEAKYFLLELYTKTVFQAIIPVSKTVKVSTARKGKFKTLQHEMPNIELGIIHANKAIIRFKNKISLSFICTV